MSNSSTVFDCSDNYMNQTNSHIRSSTVDRKAVGGPVDNARSRKCSNSTVLPPPYLRMNSAHQSSNMISLSTSNNLKFDRSLSEPSDTRMASSQNQLNHINSNKYKTELCRSFDESRQCKYGEKCRYAHGNTELRTPARHPKYKTEPCRTYHSSGFCPYGPRCHFIHNEYERKNTQSPNNCPTNVSGGNPANINQSTVMKENSNQNNQHGTSSNSSLSPQHSPTLPLFQAQMSPTGTSFANNNTSSGGNLSFGMKPKSKFTSISSSSLGSTADSPPSSVTDSPTLSLSPLFFGEDFSTTYNLSSSPSSSSSSSTPLSSSSSSTSISGATLDGLLTYITGGVTNAFDLLTISKYPSDLSTTNQFHMPERFLLEEKLDRSNFIQDGSIFAEKGFGTSKLSYSHEWAFGGLLDYGGSLLQTSD